MSSHICTNESLSAGGVELGISKCIICCKQTKQTAGYIGVYCHSCKQTWDSDFAGDLARIRRQLLGLNRTQIAKQMELSKHTIHSYEWRKCPDSYLFFLEKLLLSHNPTQDKETKSEE